MLDHVRHQNDIKITRRAFEFIIGQAIEAFTPVGGHDFAINVDASDRKTGCSEWLKHPAKTTANIEHPISTFPARSDHRL